MKKGLKFLPLMLIAAFGLAACNFDFLNISVQEITLSEVELILAPQQTYQLTADIYPVSATNKNINWSSSDDCASVVDGLITAESVGNAIITATAADGSGVTATCDLTIQQVDVTGITLSPTVLELYVGQQSTITETVLPTNASNKNVIWTTTDESIVTVTNGSVEGQSVGNATITATTEDGSFAATCAISVVETPDIVKTSLDSNYSDYVDHNAYDLDSCPAIGTGKLLVIPIWFTNSGTYITNNIKKANVLSDIQAAYFGTTSQTGWNSVETFYDTESKSALSLEGTVSDWYACGQSSTSYYSDSTGGTNTVALVKTASDWYFTNHPSESRTDYDRDGNGYLDGVMLIYGAPDYSALGNDSATNLWAYCYWMQDQNGGYNSIANPGPNVFFWASYDFMYGSTTALLRAGTSYGSGDTSHCSIDAHTYIHEMGHVFGLDDYYDYSSQYTPAGGFSMQDYNVGGHDPFSVMALGWASPYIPTESCSITINDFQSSHDLILLTPSWNTFDSPFDEYLLLELYTPTGLNEFDSDYAYTGNYPQGASASGIRLWHIDARLSTYISGIWSTTLTSNTMANNIYTAMSNTYYTQDTADYASVLGQSYSDYNLLQLIRNSTSINYYPTTTLSNANLFQAGSSFSMSTYYRQFVGGTSLNSGASLGWSFTVESCSSTSATISLTKAS